MALCGWEAVSPNEACLSAVRQGHALSAAEASGLSCESSPPPAIKPKNRMIADRRNIIADRGDREECPSESSVRSLHSCGLITHTTVVYQTSQEIVTEKFLMLSKASSVLVSYKRPNIFIFSEKCLKITQDSILNNAVENSSAKAVVLLLFCSIPTENKTFV